jgi:hypothetical protein
MMGKRIARGDLPCHLLLDGTRQNWAALVGRYLEAGDQIPDPTHAEDRSMSSRLRLQPRAGAGSHRPATHEITFPL